MSELNQNPPSTVPDQPESKPPLRKIMPAVVALVVIIGLIGIANISSLIHGNKKAAPASALPIRPAAPNAEQVSSFEAQQQLQAKRDPQERDHQREIAAALQQLQDAQGIPGNSVPYPASVLKRKLVWQVSRLRGGALYLLVCAIRNNVVRSTHSDTSVTQSRAVCFEILDRWMLKRGGR